MASILIALSLLVAGAGILLLPLRAAAEHFDITLTVSSPQGRETAGWDTSPPEMGVNPRPVVAARAGQEIRVEWSMRSAYPHGIMKGVNVHFTVVPEAEIGQKTLPPASAERLLHARALRSTAAARATAAPFRSPCGGGGGAARWMGRTRGSRLQRRDLGHFSA